MIWKKLYNEIELLENNIVKIKLTQDQYGFCDLTDWVNLKCHKWFAHKFKKKFYISTNVCENNLRKTIQMHVMIMNPHSNQLINHKDSNGLNNKRNNLEYCTFQENVRYRNIPNNNTSGFKGVSFHKRSNKWRAYISIKISGVQKQISLGYYDNKIDAAKVYNVAARKYFGDFALLNVIE